MKDFPSMMDYFTKNGTLDKPLVTFTDKNGTPSKLYQVSRNGSSILVTIDGRDRLPLVRAHFLSDIEAGNWFAENEVSELTKSQADRQTSPADRLKYYQDNATETTREMFERLITQKMSNESVKTYLQNQAKIDGLSAEIIFK